MKSATHYLADAAPGWFTIDTLDKDALIGRARIPKTPWTAKGLHLRAFGDRTPKVREETPGVDLPARCPERHIQGDQTFCLGLSYIDVRSMNDARGGGSSCGSISSARASLNARASGRLAMRSITGTPAGTMNAPWLSPPKQSWKKSTRRRGWTSRAG